MKNNSLARCFSEYIPYNPSNLVFITSLTNTWEDLPVAIYFKKNQARVIGTVRSWDNLTNHGYLKFVPDIFVHHSEAMKNYARNFQNMTNNSDILLVTPVYQNKFRVKKQNKAADITNVAYMCMGKITNPDDEHFAQWLIKEWGLLPNKFNLTIVQHPKFSISINDSNMGGNIGIKVFNYSESNLIDYYNFIAEQDVIICGGTTAALDSAFIRTPTIAIGFEITEQNYWASALRYFDTKPHTKDFFNMCNVLVISNKQDLVNTLVSSDDILCLSDELVSYFTGNSNIDFNQALISVLKTF
jgi:hypothetical protein